MLAAISVAFSASCSGGGEAANRGTLSMRRDGAAIHLAVARTSTTWSDPDLVEYTATVFPLTTDWREQALWVTGARGELPCEGETCPNSLPRTALVRPSTRGTGIEYLLRLETSFTEVDVTDLDGDGRNEIVLFTSVHTRGAARRVFRFDGRQFVRAAALDAAAPDADDLEVVAAVAAALHVPTESITGHVNLDPVGRDILVGARSVITVDDGTRVRLALVSHARPVRVIATADVAASASAPVCPDNLVPEPAFRLYTRPRARLGRERNVIVSFADRAAGGFRARVFRTDGTSLVADGAAPITLRSFCYRGPDAVHYVDFIADSDTAPASMRFTEGSDPIPERLPSESFATRRRFVE